MSYTFYYRNYLKSCNYSCEYCPFAKAPASEKMLVQDQHYLQKFVSYIADSPQKYKLFFAPRGEALLYEYYQQALLALSKQDNTEEIVIQTNLSSSLEWLSDVDSSKLILWTTYHPSQVESQRFFNQVRKLQSYPIRFTIGVVGVKENFTQIKEMHQLLDQLGEKRPYLWINAYKDKRNYYSREDIQYLTQYDRLFESNLKNYKCTGIACKTGEEVFFVEWNGNLHRCWQDKLKLGNLYTNSLDEIAASSNCNKNICSCFIGYSHIKSLHLEQVYANSLLGRIP